MDHQEIYLEPNPDGESYPITGSDVEIHTCRVYERTRDSSKVRSRAIIDYRWETKLYDGRLVAVHKDGNYLAYVLHSRNACSVRVINRSTKARALIKGFVGQVVDISWSFNAWPLLLAVTDEGGNLIVYTVEENDTGDEISVKKYLRVKGLASVGSRQPPHRIAWCPYVPDQHAASEAQTDSASSPVPYDQHPESGGSDEQAHLLAVYHNAKVDILFVDKVVKEYGDETSIASIEHGFLTQEIDSDITALAISPDATALALSSHGGEVRFYILDTDSGIRLAQAWSPHKGRPVTSIVFLDNFLASAQSEDTFWKYAVTACDGNRELKLWNCENWDCLGTLRIDPPETQSEHIALTLTVDWTSSYIFLTDMERKSLYVVEIVPWLNRIRFSSFTEFPLLHPALSLATVSARPKRFRPSSPGAAAELEDSGDNDIIPGGTVGVHMFLYAVNPKSLLELDIRFVPPRRDDIDYSLLSSMSSSKLGTLRDEVSDMSSDLLHVASSDVNNTSGKDFLDFGSRRRSTPNHADSPNDRTPTRELELNRRVSASPSSQEVSKILANSMGSAVNDPSCLINIKCDEEDNERPITPTAQSLYHMKSSDNVAVPAWNQPKGSPSPGAAAMAGPDNDVLNKMSGDLARITAVISRQEEQLQQLKHLMHVLQEQHRQGAEDAQSLGQYSETLKSDHFEQNLLRTIEGVIQRSLDSTLESEIRNTVVPGMMDALKPVRDSVEADTAHILTATDAVIRENIGKMMKSKQFVDAIGQAAGHTAAHVATAEAQAAYREAFQKIIAPSFDTTAQQLFAQVNDAFQRGTKEYLDQLQRHLAKVEDEWKKRTLDQFVAHLKETSDRQMSTVEASMKKYFDLLYQRVHASLDGLVRSVVKDEVARAMADGQQALNDTVMKVLRSQAPTPVPSNVQQGDRQQIMNEIIHYLNAEQYNNAFQHALQARDTSLVNYVCQRIDPSRLFSDTSSPLEHPVIMSLLYQLAADLNNQTELKLKYMQEAIPSLDREALGEIGGTTVGRISDKLSTYLRANPNGPHVRRAKTVCMLLASLKSSQ